MIWVVTVFLGIPRLLCAWDELIADGRKPTAC